MPRLKLTKNGRRLIYLGVAAYFVFLLHALPASFLTRYILPKFDKSHSIHLQSVHGSIWQGSAVDANVANFDLGKLSWNLHSWGLLLGKLKLYLEFGEDNVQGTADVSVGMSGEVNAENINMQLPAANLMPLFYGYPVSISGMLKGNIVQLKLKRGQVINAQGRIVWQDAAIRAPQNIDMGDYLITLTPVNTGSKIMIKDQGRGPIQANLTVFVQGTGQYRLNGWLKSRDPNQQAISETLRLFGRPDSSGHYWINFNGRLRNWRA